ncbi:HNH endonuclease [Spirosoma luteum]|uniref:HNH endonuclease n=1 Tax=Spirosoma luteum TaxID=431553 RepID=UPI00037C7B4A|nr:HNH endonuclease [Spirosoma luteum]
MFTNANFDRSVAATYARKFAKVRRANGKAPHKPVLLITLLELIDKGLITENRITISPELVAIFKENFSLLVTATDYKDDFTQPFYYLQSDGFWFLKPKVGFAFDTYVRSVHTLSDRLDFGYFSSDLFLLLVNGYARNLLKNSLLDAFFVAQKVQFLQGKNARRSYLSELKTYLLNEKEAAYLPLPPVEDEETRFVRGGLFKKLVPKVYDFTCAISGMKVIAMDGSSLVEACHIVPISISGDDKVTNGIALCPTLHTAFDRGMIAVDERFRVVVSPSLADGTTSPYNLRQFHGEALRLPFGEMHYPKPESFQWHLKEKFKR